MVTKKDNQKLYAMKVVQKDNLLFRGNSSVTQAITEKQVLEDLSARPHPFVVSLRYAFQDVSHLYLIMDYVGGGDLFSLLESKTRFPEEWVTLYGGEIVSRGSNGRDHALPTTHARPRHARWPRKSPSCSPPLPPPARPN